MTWFIYWDQRVQSQNVLEPHLTAPGKLFPRASEPPGMPTHSTALPTGPSTAAACRASLRLPLLTLRATSFLNCVSVVTHPFPVQAPAAISSQVSYSVTSAFLWLSVLKIEGPPLPSTHLRRQRYKRVSSGVQVFFTIANLFIIHGAGVRRTQQHLETLRLSEM